MQTTTYSHASTAAESVRPALPTLAPGVTIALLVRVWHATPEDRRHKLGSLLESRVLVAGRAKPLRLFTLAEADAAISGVAPRFAVRFFDPRRSGVQIVTFVVESDALTFSAGLKLDGRAAPVIDLR